MKLVFFIDHLRPDGAQYMLKRLVAGLSQRGHDVDVICLNDSWDPATVQEIRDSDVKVRIIGKLGLFSGIGLFWIFQALRAGKYDAAVTILFASDLIGRTLSRLAGIPLIVTSVQTRDEFYSALQRGLISFTARFHDYAVLCSEHLGDFVIRHEGVKHEQIKIIYNSVQTSQYVRPEPLKDLRENFGISPNALLSGSLGRLTYQKGYDVLLDAIAQVDDVDFVHLIAGTGEEEQALKQKAEDLGISDRVIFVGYWTDVPTFLHNLDLYVQASRYEGMPFAVLEAMASGRAIVATAADGSQELISAETYGWLVPTEDPDALAGAMRAALKSPEQRKAHGQAAQQRAFDVFDEHSVVSAWESLLASEKKPGLFA